MAMCSVLMLSSMNKLLSQEFDYCVIVILDSSFFVLQFAMHISVYYKFIISVRPIFIEIFIDSRGQFGAIGITNSHFSDAHIHSIHEEMCIVACVVQFDSSDL